MIIFLWYSAFNSASNDIYFCLVYFNETAQKIEFLNHCLKGYSNSYSNLIRHCIGVFEQFVEVVKEFLVCNRPTSVGQLKISPRKDIMLLLLLEGGEEISSSRNVVN